MAGKYLLIFKGEETIESELQTLEEILDIKYHLRGIKAVFGHLKDFSW